MSGVMLFGGTDLTLAVAEVLVAEGTEIAGIVTVGPQFSISYSQSPVANVRGVDMLGWAQCHSVPVYLYTDMDGVADFIRSTAPRLGLAVGWYHMIPRRVRDAFSLGCLGIHASLLPKLRGGAPLNWAILSGASVTGVSLFQLGDGVDDGPLYGQESIAIAARTTIAELVAQASLAACDLIRRCLPAILDGGAQPAQQQGTASYGLQRRLEDGEIDWTRSAVEVDRLVRAVGRPYPGAFTWLDGQRLIIWAVTPDVGLELYGCSGQIMVLDHRVFVVAGQVGLRIDEASLEDGRDAMALLMRSGQRQLGRDGGLLQAKTALPPNVSNC